LFTFGFHKQPISSIDWCPFEDSMIAVSSADDSVTVWDLSATHDDDEPVPQEDMVTSIFCFLVGLIVLFLNPFF
jgi:WD40 repeat protein